MLRALAACSDSSEELISLDKEENETRTDAGTPAYYWANGIKQAITLTDKKTYMLFHSSDQNAILSKLATMGYYIEEKDIHNSGIYPKGMEDTNEKTFYYDDCKWIGINLSCEQVLNIPEILYAAPYILNQEEEPKFCITNLVYVLTNGNKDFVEQISSDYQAYYLGYRTGYSGYNVHYLACDKNSKGNSLEIANALVEKHLFIGAEPVIMGPYHGHGFATEGPINNN